MSTSVHGTTRWAVRLRPPLLAAIGLVALFVIVAVAVLGPALFVQSFLSAVMMGSQYALIAIGYTMVYGIVRLINFAHGDIFMVGSFVAYYLLAAFSIPWWVAMVLSMLLTGLVGVLVERVAYRPLRHAPRASLLITAIAVSLFLENSGNVIFGAQSKAFLVQSSLIANRQWTLLGQPIYYQSLVIAVPLIATVLVVGLTLFLGRSKLGVAIRATSQDPEMAKMLGIPVNRVIALVFFIGSALAAAGGTLYSMQYVQINPLMGILPGIKAFTAAVLGGIGSIPGAVLGGILLGLIESFVVVFFPALTSFQQVFAVIILLAILLVRPTGLMGEDLTEKV